MTGHTQFSRTLLLLVVLLTATLLAACNTMGMQTETAAEQAEPLGDGEIVAVMQTINQAEIRQAEMALNRSSNPDVRYTAGQIVEDHRTSQERFASLASELGISPRDNALSTSLQEQAQQIQERLRGLEGREFDQTYLQAQAKLHQLALDTVQNELIPAASAAQLREAVAASAPRLEQHLQLARESLGQTSPTRG